MQSTQGHAWLGHARLARPRLAARQAGKATQIVTSGSCVTWETFFAEVQAAWRSGSAVVLIPVDGLDPGRELLRPDYIGSTIASLCIGTSGDILGLINTRPF